MKPGKRRLVPLFQQKRFWPSVFWLFVLAAGTAAAALFNMPEFLVAVILVSFLGLNEIGRWPYKTNLVLCAGAAVLAILAGTFSWLQTGSTILLLLVLAGFMLYFRDYTKRMLPTLQEFASVLSRGKSAAQVVSSAMDEIGEMTGEAVFIALTDGKAGLYLPEYREDKRIDLKRDGGTLWKTYASGGSGMTGKVDPQTDIPLYREARSLMSVALEAGGETIGVVQIESEQAYAFSDEDMSTFGVLAFLVAQAVYPYIKEAERREEKIAESLKLESPQKPEQKKIFTDADHKHQQMELSFEEEKKEGESKPDAPEQPK